MRTRFSVLLLLALSGVATAGPLVIAHRGASGYLPEHTLEAAAYAHALGADFIEQDVVLSRDGVVVVLHDIHLDATTDVKARFPERHRPDGRYYAIDFTWEELRSLRVRERFAPATGRPVFPRRFADNGSSFRLCTLAEQLRLIEGLNRSTGRTAGVYVEFKEPAFHAGEGRDLGAALLAVLAQNGYGEPGAKIFVQCFDPAALRRLRTELGTKLPLVLLLETSDRGLLTSGGLREIAGFAQGIGPPLSLVMEVLPDGRLAPTSLLADAHAAGLVVHPYTFRADAPPPGVADITILLRAALDAGMDGFFIDQPDVGRAAVDQKR